MEETPDVPKEFMDPILPCLDLLKKGNIHLYAEKKSLWKKYCRLPLNMMCSIFYQIGLTMYLGNVFRGELKLDELAYVVSVYVVSMQAVFKAMVVILHKKEIRSIILQMGSMWRTKDLTEVQINKKNALLKRLKFCYAVFYWINMIGSWQYILAPLLETVFRKFILQQECGLLLPFSCSFPFDPTGNWPRYIGVYIFETYSMLRIVYFYLGTEFLMITLCSHLATEFTLLQEDLKNMKPGNLAGLNIVIENHQKLISIAIQCDNAASLLGTFPIDNVVKDFFYALLAQQLDDVFDKVIFVNLSSASISICFFGLSAKVSHGALHMANNFVAVVSLTLPLFNLCYYGECLMEASAGIADSVYNNLWYRGDIRFQKLLWFIMRRSQKPCCLTSLKYNPITLSTFTTVLSTTWSYFSLALSVYEEES